MARIDVEEPSEFHEVIIDNAVQVKSALPVAGLTFATRLRRFTIVEDDPLGTNTVSVAQNQSTSARGVLIRDQYWNKDDALTLDENSKIGIAWEGRIRGYGIAPIAKNDRLVVGANGYFRTFDAGAGDLENMVVAKAICGITVTGDVVDVEAIFAHGGV